MFAPSSALARPSAPARHQLLSLQAFVPALAAPRPLRASARRASRGGPTAKAARRYDDDDTRVTLDGEDEWGSEVGPLGGADSGAFVSQALRGAALVTDRLAAAAQSLAPDAPPRAVRTAVAGGLLLLAASFVKGVLSFFMTMGTVALGAYVATRVLGSDPEGGGGSARRRRDDRGARRGAAPERRRRERGGGADGVAGFLSGVLGGEEEDLMDVWFSDGGKKKGGKDGKRRR